MASCTSTQVADNALQKQAAAGGKTFTVAVLGAAGGIGQPLSLLLKLDPLVGDLRCYDVAPVTPGVGVDLSHIETNSTVTGFGGPDQLGAALTGCDLVLIPAGVPRKPGMTRDDLFGINAGIVKTLAEGVAEHCPGAIVGVISNPVNSTVPVFAEVLKQAGCFDPKKLLGVTTLDVVRANTFVAAAKGLDPRDVEVPVVGGHAGTTILPLLSQATPPMRFSQAEAEALTARIQNAGTEVVDAKAGGGSATLSMAFAAARFGKACLRGLAGRAGVTECAFVAASAGAEGALPEGAAFFATRVTLGPGGAEEVHGVAALGALSEGEAAGVAALLPELAAHVAKGVAFAQG